MIVVANPGPDSSHAAPEAHVSPTAKLFVQRLKSLDRGELAMLRRNAGNSIAESREAIGLFYRLLPPEVVGSRNEEVYFLVATLYGLNGLPFNGDFGATMRQVKLVREGLGSAGEDGSSGLDRRMSILLDSDFELIDGRPGGGELAYRLRQCVRLAASTGVGVDWEKLLDDLTYWQHPEKRAHKRWARSYYGESERSEAQSEGGKSNAD